MPEDPQHPTQQPTQHEVTQLLHAVREGDPRAGERLLPMVYEELRRLARSYMKKEREGQTLQATALVHEAYMRLVGTADVSWDSRAHFFGAAALAMRRILVERARHRKRLKHGGAVQRVELHENVRIDADDAPESGTDLVALDAALDRLAAYDARKCEVVMLKYFAGLTNDEVAAALNLSSATVRNEWTFARAWLMREVGREATREAASDPGTSGGSAP